MLSTYRQLSIHPVNHGAKDILTRFNIATRAANVSSPQPGQLSSVSDQFELLASVIAPDTLVKADVTSRGRGLVPLRDLTKNDIAISVDWANMLCVPDDPNIKSDFSKQVLEDWQMLHGPLPPLLVNTLLDGSLTWAMRMTAFLLWLRKNATGILRLYIDVLPKVDDITSLMMYTNKEVEELQDIRLKLLAREERNLVSQIHETTFSSTTGQLKTLKLADKPEDTFWALSLVNSRSFSETIYGETVSLMVPCADMANHTPLPNCEFKFNEDLDCFELVANQAIPTDTEVCISYGCLNKTNAELMKDYGFVIAGNLNDRIEFSAGDDIASRLAAGTSQPISLHAANFMAALGIQGYSSARKFELTGDFAPEKLLVDEIGNIAVVDKRRRVILFFSVQPFLRDFPRGEIQGNAAEISAAMSDDELQSERISVKTLVYQCQSMLSAMPTSIAEDRELISGGGLTSRVYQAVVARLEIKYTLQAAIEHLRMYGSVIGVAL